MTTDNLGLNAGSGGENLVTAEVTHSGDTAHLQIVALAGLTGSEGSWTFAPINGDATDGLLVNLGSNNDVVVTNAGTFAVQVDGAALTALQLIDNIVLAEDAVHGSGDPGVQALAVRNDTLAALAGTDGDYAPLQVNASGALFIQEGAALDVSAATVSVDWNGTAPPIGAGTEAAALRVTLATDSTGVVSIDDNAGSLTVDNGGTFVVQIDGDALTALQLTNNPVAVLGTATYTEATTYGMIAGAVRNDTLAALANTDNEIAPFQVNASGALYIQEGAAMDVSAATVTVDLGANNDVTIDGSSIVQAEDAVHGSGDAGVMALAVRDTSPAAVSGTDGDYEPLHVSDDGGVWASLTPSHTGGYSGFTSVDLDESEEQVSATACTVGYLYFWNLTAAPLWAQIFNATAASIAPGTDAPDLNFMIPANADSDGAGVTIPLPNGGLGFSTALSVAVTTGSGTDSGAPGAGDAGCFILYKN